MLINSILSQTQFQLEFVSFFTPCPVCVSSDKVDPKIFISLNKSRQSSLPPFLRYGTVLCLTVYMTFLFFNGLCHSTSPHIDVKVKASATIFSILFPITCFLMVTTWFTDSSDFVTLLNLFLTYERNRWGKERSGREEEIFGRWQSLLKVLVGLFGFGFSLVCPLSLTLLNILEPDRLPFIGSIMPQLECGDSLERKIVIFWGHFCVIVFQTWQHYALVPSYILTTANFFVATILSLCAYMGEIMRYVFLKKCSYVIVVRLSKHSGNANPAEVDNFEENF